MTDTKPVPVPPDFYEKTLRNVANLRQEYDHNDTLHRFLGDAEASIANLIVLQAEATRDVEAVQAQCCAFSKERDEAKNKAAVAVADRLAAIEHWKKTADACAVERNEAYLEVHRIRAALGCVQFEPAEDAARRLVSERDSARAEARFQAGKAEAAAIARDVANDRATRWHGLYSALIEKAEQSRSAFKVGDRVANKELAFQAATVIAFFDAIDGVRFVAVENDWGQAHLWRLDLVCAVAVRP